MYFYRTFHNKKYCGKISKTSVNITLKLFNSKIQNKNEKIYRKFVLILSEIMYAPQVYHYFKCENGVYDWNIDNLDSSFFNKFLLENRFNNQSDCISIENDEIFEFKLLDINSTSYNSHYINTILSFAVDNYQTIKTKTIEYKKIEGRKCHNTLTYCSKEAIHQIVGLDFCKDCLNELMEIHTEITVDEKPDLSIFKFEYTYMYDHHAEFDSIVKFYGKKYILTKEYESSVNKYHPKVCEMSHERILSDDCKDKYLIENEYGPSGCYYYEQEGKHCCMLCNANIYYNKGNKSGSKRCKKLPCAIFVFSHFYFEKYKLAKLIEILDDIKGNLVKTFIDVCMYYNYTDNERLKITIGY